MLSGGLDSTTLLHLALSRGLAVSALHVSYGQAAAIAEREAAARVCEASAIQLRVVSYMGSAFSTGEIRGRNAFLLHIGLTEFPSDAGVVLLGIHAGTAYRDCSADFVDMMGRSFDFHTDGAITISAPFIEMSKADIADLGASLSVPLATTFSCEAGSIACGRCQSCLDREFVLARSPRT